MIIAPSASSDTAVWRIRRPWPAAIGFALVPVIFTAAGSAAAQLLGEGEAVSVLVIAAGAAVAALIGLVVMRTSPPAMREYGFRLPRGARTVWWFLPMPLTIVLVVATQGIQVTGTVLAAYALLTVVVALNEEVWFRGIVLAVLRAKGVRTAVVGSTVLFAVLHLTNLAGGADPASAALQVVFAALFGLVAAELMVLTRSLWPAIAWHAAWDFVNYAGGNSTSGTALAGIGIASAVILVYAVVLWRRAWATGRAGHTPPAAA